MNSVTCTPMSKTVNLAGGESAHPSSSVMVQVSGRHESLICRAAIGSTSKPFLDKLTYLYLPVWKFGLNLFHKLVKSEETLSKYTKMQEMTVAGHSRLQVIVTTGGPVSLPVHCVLPSSCSCCDLMALLPAHVMPWHELSIWPKCEKELHELPDPPSPLASPECKTYEHARPKGANEF